MFVKIGTKIINLNLVTEIYAEADNTFIIYFATQDGDSQVCVKITADEYERILHASKNVLFVA